MINVAGKVDLDHVPVRTVQSLDGVTIAYQVVGNGPRTLLCANGLGGRLYSWAPLVDALAGTEYRVVTWDYRGLFESTTPTLRRHLSIPHHAEDARAILDDLGVERAVLCGWSMGVQVALELATVAPERVAGLVLLNGTYGHAFSSGFQPIAPLPGVSRWGHRAIEWLVHRPHLAATIASSWKALMTPTLALFWLVSRAPADRVRPMLERYREDVLDEKNFVNFLRLFQELDGHSVYHHLRDIEAPALIVSGRYDLMTPAYQSKEMAKHIPHNEWMHLKRASHFALVERPETVVPKIEQFLDERVRW